MKLNSYTKTKRLGGSRSRGVPEVRRGLESDPY